MKAASLFDSLFAWARCDVCVEGNEGGKYVEAPPARMKTLARLNAVERPKEKASHEAEMARRHGAPMAVRTEAPPPEINLFAEDDQPPNADEFAVFHSEAVLEDSEHVYAAVAAPGSAADADVSNIASNVTQLTHATRELFENPEDAIGALRSHLDALEPPARPLGAPAEAVEARSGPSTFEGQYYGDLYHGEGTLTFPDGSTYEGSFASGRAQGDGRLVTATGDTFDGQWHGDCAHGTGRYNYREGGSYEGQWYQDEKSGQGTEVYKNGSEYIGEFKSGRKHGHGQFLTNSGAVLFDGRMQYDKMHGDGCYRFPDGRTYEGQWIQGQMHGIGTLEWADGLKYLGSMFKNERHGDGFLKWPNGQTYRGQWKTGKQEGHGTVKLPSGEEKSGLWRSGAMIATDHAAPGSSGGKERVVDQGLRAQ